MKSNVIRRSKAYREEGLKVLRDARIVRNMEQLARSLEGMPEVINATDAPQAAVPQSNSSTRKLIQDGVKNVTNSNQ